MRVVITEIEKVDPVGQLDISRRLGYPRLTVVQWIQRGVFDLPPKWTVSDAPVWNWPDVLAWAKANGKTDRMGKWMKHRWELDGSGGYHQGYCEDSHLLYTCRTAHKNGPCNLVRITCQSGLSQDGRSVHIEKREAKG